MQSLQAKLRAAAEGTTELMVMRPTALCSDKGRAINNSDKDWPETLRGDETGLRALRDQLKAGIQPKRDDRRVARGNAGRRRFFLKWGQQQKR